MNPETGLKSVLGAGIFEEKIFLKIFGATTASEVTEMRVSILAVL